MIHMNALTYLLDKEQYQISRQTISEQKKKIYLGKPIMYSRGEKVLEVKILYGALYTNLFYFQNTMLFKSW